jgi:predicted nucleic acid-binding protein
VILLDTSAIYALADRNDPNHGRAVALFRQALQSQEDLLVHSYILVEASALLQRRLGLEPALRFLEEAGSLVVHWVTARDHSRAVGLLKDRGRRGLSLVDCTSFAVMRHYQGTTALAFDPDFELEGFAQYQGTTH